MPGDRRQFLKSSGLVLSYIVGGQVLRLSTSAAYAAGLPHQILKPDDVATLEALAEVIVPGARKAGISHYIDKQLEASPQDSLLMLKYLGVGVADFRGFYQGGLQSAARFSNTSFNKPWSMLSEEQTGILLRQFAAGSIPEWDGPPAAFFFFVLRSDACDVVYGTAEGFDRLGTPPMTHIEPPEAW